MLSKWLPPIRRRSRRKLQYSDYFAGLEGPAKSRYQEKITVCGFDPYALRKSDFSETIELLPKVQYPDIYILLTKREGEYRS